MSWFLQRENFWGQIPTESLRTHDLEVIVAQSEVTGQKPVVLQKIRGVIKNYHFFIFGPIAWKTIEHGLIYKESMSYSFPIDRTKNKKVLVFCNTANQSRQILK